MEHPKQLTKIIMADLYFQKLSSGRRQGYTTNNCEDHPRHQEAPRALYPDQGDAPQRRTQRCRTRSRNHRSRHSNMKPVQSAVRKRLSHRSRSKIQTGQKKLGAKRIGISLSFTANKEWEAVRRRGRYLMSTFPKSDLFTEALFLNVLSLYFLENMEQAKTRRERLVQLDPSQGPLLDKQIKKENESAQDDPRCLRLPPPIISIDILRAAPC